MKEVKIVDLKAAGGNSEDYDELGKLRPNPAVTKLVSAAHRLSQLRKSAPLFRLLNLRQCFFVRRASGKCQCLGPLFKAKEFYGDSTKPTRVNARLDAKPEGAASHQS